MPPSVQTQRDNLTIGLFLGRNLFGETLDRVLQVALGYSASGPQPYNHYLRRFRLAEEAGRDAFRNRTPGYFSFNAMPFGGQYIYKATFYVWINPQTAEAQIVPLRAGDLAAMRRLRDRDLNTRQSTTRSIRTAHDVEEQKQAVQRQDWPALQEIQSRMTEDGSLGELLSGLHGIPYADIQDIIPQLPNHAMLFQFQRDAQQIQSLSRRLTQAQASLSQQLMSWVMLQTGVPSNAPQLALQQAQNRLANLP